MTIYTVALLARTVADGLKAVPDHIEQAATAMGYRGCAGCSASSCPLAVPVIAAGLRVAAVSNVSIVSVASLIGVSQLGDLLVDGYNRVIWGELRHRHRRLRACWRSCSTRSSWWAPGCVTPWLRAQGGRA